MIDEGQIQMGQ